MHDSLPMSIVQGPEDLVGTSRKLAYGKWCSISDEIVKGITLNVGHDQKRRSILKEEIVNSRNMGVLQPRHTDGFLHETLEELRVLIQVLVDGLDGDHLLEMAMAGSPDFADSAATDPVLQDQVSNGLIPFQPTASLPETINPYDGVHT
jgi:hypothetical protein